MPPELHLRPDRLHAHAAVASGLADELLAALRGAPVAAGLFAGERERLDGAVGAAVRELAELSAVLRAAAGAARGAEADVAAVLSRLRDGLGPGQP
ncbi:hypothetical protein [Pseudonocardia zijingensis]|jgi:hypothetical protein|uniref:Excreted virulence factor EspC (Type VII ESX diderm) n=1 Tax=Pseudonocardia zijingensis TaxID=153376 RepID=A0ABN1NKU3_9PSEU